MIIDINVKLTSMFSNFLKKQQQKNVFLQLLYKTSSKISNNFRLNCLVNVQLCLLLIKLKMSVRFRLKISFFNVRQQVLFQFL